MDVSWLGVCLAVFHSDLYLLYLIFIVGPNALNVSGVCNNDSPPQGHRYFVMHWCLGICAPFCTALAEGREKSWRDFSKKYIPGLRSRAEIVVLIADVRLCGGCFDMKPDKIFCREYAGYILETPRDKKKKL